MGRSKNKKSTFRFYGSLAVIAMMLAALLINSFSFFSTQKVGAAIPFLAQETQLASSANVGSALSTVGIDSTNNVFTSWVGDDGSDDVIYGNNDAVSCSTCDVPDTITYQTSNATAGSLSTTVNIGTADTNRLVVVFAMTEANSSNALTGVTVDSKACNVVQQAYNTDGLGNRTELWYCDEDDLGASNGSVTVTATGSGLTATNWAVHAQVYTGVAQNGPTDSGANTTAISSLTVPITGMDVPENGLILMGAANGLQGAGVSSWTSPLTNRTDADPGSADAVTSSGIESTAQTNKTYTLTWTGSAPNRSSGAAASWAPDPGTPCPEYTPVSTTTGGDLADPDMAMDKNGNFIAAWEGAGTGDSTGIFMQAYRFNSGTNCYEKVGSETKVNTSTTNTQLNPSVAIDYNGPSSGNNTRFIVAWESDHASVNDKDIYFQRYDVDFTQTATSPSAVGSETRANTTTTDQQKQPAVSMNTLGEFAVAWFSNNTSNRVMYRPYAADGTALEASGVQINSATAIDGNIAAATDKKTRPASLNDDEPRSFLIAYPALFSTPPSGTDDGIGVRKITCIDPNTANSSDTDVTCAVDDVEMIANDSLTGTQSNPAIDADNIGNFTVVWENNVSSNADIVGQGFTDSSKRNGSNFTLNNTTTGNQTNPDIAMNASGIYAVSFTSGNDNNYYYRAFDSEFAKIDSEVIAHPSSTNDQQTVDTDIAPNGNHIQVWKDYTDDTIRFTLREFDNDATAIKENVQVDTLSTVSSDNPSVSFFKDTAGAGVGKFVIAWQSDATSGGDGNDIYYRIYDAAGDAEAAAAIVNSSTTGEQVTPDVSAGYADTFSIGFIDENGSDSAISAYFDGASFTINALQTCATDCGTIRVAHDAATGRAAFVWSENSAAPVVYTRKTLSGALNGAAVQVTGPDAEDEALPDVAFFNSGNKYTVVFTNAPGLSTANIYGTSYNFNAGGAPTVDTAVALLSAYTQSTGGQSNPRISMADDYGLITWTDFPTLSTDNNIYGQFFYNGAVMGPTFRINSTQAQNQSLPAVGTNTSGETVVAWEGYAGDDDYDIITQLLQNPFNLQEITPFEPTARQEVQAGGQFLFVPNNITFPDVNLNTEQSTTQTVSIRDSTNGGDTLKYIEIQDATGTDFTLTIQASDFFAAADNRPYITNEAHFRLRNWDQSTTNVDNAGACTGNATLCFLTVDSSEGSTAFALDSDTESFTFINSQQVLATKIGTVNNEIGRWRIYPEFEITVPPIIPPGVHQATITFTLT